MILSNLFGVYFYTFLPRFFDNTIFLSYYSAFSLFTMFYNYPLKLSGGGKEVRTPDPLLAKQVLSQLSYTPIHTSLPKSYNWRYYDDIFECRVHTQYINEKISSKSPIRRFWWVWEDLNFRPYAYQAYALTTWATNPSRACHPIAS